MKTAFVTASLFFLIATYIACGKDDGGGSGGGTFIPDLSNRWINKADTTSTNEFFFLADQDSVNNSAFTGNENPTGGGSQLHFAGSFTNHNINFTYDSTSGSKSGKSFSGTINDASNVITLSSSTLGSLVLEKR